MTAYLMTVAMGIPLSGWLAERLGARRVFCLAIAVFTVASLLCALSQDLTMLTLSRVLQGAGGAMMVPVGTLVVLRGTAKKDLLRATAYLVWPGLLAPVLAPLVGGALTTFLSWHWIFLINLPLGLAAFVAALRLVPGTTGDANAAWTGWAWPSPPWVWGPSWWAWSWPAAARPALLAAIGITAGLVFLSTAAWWMRRARSPLFDLGVFSTRTFRSTATGGFIYRLTISRCRSCFR